MLRVRSLFRITPTTSTGASALTYVPFVMLSRGLGFVRLMLVARILGEAGKLQFGLYRPTQELINPIVALVLFGASDVAERYASLIERQAGAAEGGGAGGAGGLTLARWLGRQFLRVFLTGAVGCMVMAAASPWIGVFIWGQRASALVITCGITVLFLALYQQLAAVLRGLRAYSAAAGMEFFSALLLLVLAIVAAFMRSAVALAVSYAGAIFMTAAVYGVILQRHLGARQGGNAGAGAPELVVTTGAAPVIASAMAAEAAIAPDAVLASAEEVATVSPPAEGRDAPPRMSRFAAWALVRLLCVMGFNFLSLWGVRFLAAASGSLHATPAAASSNDALSSTADYGVAFTIAQLLAYIALTLWASSYGIAAGAWSHGQRRRAWVVLFRVGKYGATLMTLAAVFLLLTRGLFAFLMPAYRDAIIYLLPGMLASSIWYGLLAFASSCSDLRESPQRGAGLWGIAVAIQLGGILVARYGGLAMGAAAGGSQAFDPREYVMVVSAVGVGVALLFAPAVVCRPVRFTATGAPLAVLAVAPLALFSPWWVVDYIAAPVMLGAVGFLYASGLLIRNVDRRGARRFLARL